MALGDTPGLLDAMLARVAGGLGLLDPEAIKEAMLEVARDAFVATDEVGRIVDWNPAAERIFGWSKEEVLGRTLAELMIPERFRARHQEGVLHHQATGEGRLFNTRIAMPALTSEGVEVPVELTIGATRVRRRWVYVASMRRL